MNIELTQRQKKIVAAGVTTAAAFVVMAATILFIVYVASFFKMFSHVFLPLAVAAVLALALDPWYAWLKTRMSAALALICVFLSTTIPLGLMVYFFGALMIEQLSGISEQIPKWWAMLMLWFEENRPLFERVYDSPEMREKFSESLKFAGDPMVGIAKYVGVKFISAGSSLVSGMVSLLGWIVVPVYLAFFLMLPKIRPESLTNEHFPFLKAGTAKDVIFLIKEFFNLVVIFFRGQILIALLQGVLFAVGFTLAGLEYGIVLGLLLGFLNIIPYLGSMLGLSICLPIAWFQTGGGGILLAIVLLIFLIVQAIEGYYLTPKIMGNATGLNPLLIIVGIFFWGAALDGILGMILAIPLTAFVVVLWRLARDKYIHQLF